MVQRYQQGDLPSPVVGTPGVDPSAGKAAEKVAEASNEMTQKSLQFATQEFSKAQAQFSAAGTAAEHFFAHRTALERYQTQLAVAQAKPDIQERLNNLMKTAGDGIAEKSAKDPTAPNNLASDYASLVKSDRDALAADTGYGDKTLAHLLPFYDQQAEMRRMSLEKQAPGMVQNNLQAGVNAKFSGAKKIIDGMDVNASVTDNLLVGLQAINGIDTAIQPLIDQSKSIPIGNQQKFQEYVGQQVGEQREKLSGSMVSKMMAGVDLTGSKTPSEMQHGLTKLGGIRAIIANPPKGMQFSGEQQEKYLGQIAQREKDYTSDAVSVLKGNTVQALLDDQLSLIAPLEKAENNPTLRDSIQQQIDDRLADLGAQEKQAIKELPQGPLLNQTLIGLKQQAVALNGGAGMARNEAHSYLMALQGDDKIALQQLSVQYQGIGINLELSKQLAAQTKESQAAKMGARSTHLVDQATAISGMPAGPGRAKAAQDHALEVRKYVGAAMTADVMSDAEGARYIKQYAFDALQSAHYTDKGPILGMFGGRYQPAQPRTAKQKEEDKRQAAAEQDALFKKANTDFNAQNTIRQQIWHSGNLSLEQQLSLDQHIQRNFMTQLDSLRNRNQDHGKKPYTPDQEARWAQNWFSGKVQAAQRDELPEQLKLKQLGINTQQANTLKTMRGHHNFIPDAALQNGGTPHAIEVNPADAANKANMTTPPPATAPIIRGPIAEGAAAQ